MSKALLALEDGTLFHGRAIGYLGSTTGEVVFNTAMTGYQEILTDPSYSKQIVTLTYPHIGNTGTNPQDYESERAHAAGLIIRDMPEVASNWRMTQTLSDFLEEQKIVGIADIDTRELTRILRDKGAQRGCIMAGDVDEAVAVKLAKETPSLNGADLAKTVTVSKPYEWTASTWVEPGETRQDIQHSYHIVAMDFGIKRNILRLLVANGCKVTVVPAQTDPKAIMAMKPHGVLLSNGPGDPAPCDYAIQTIKDLLQTKVPIMGICLGHQLLALALGAKTFKMKFGHHGANHPIQDIRDKRVFITSQNHGFAVDESSLPNNIEVTHKSLFDQTIQGIRAKDAPAFSQQGHPEASPGPQEASQFFKDFIVEVSQYAKTN